LQIDYRLKKIEYHRTKTRLKYHPKPTVSY
jgi:hypothetical protein